MSTPTQDHAPRTDSPPVESPALRTRLLRKPLQAVGFWAGIALPFVYLPLLLAGTPSQRLLALGLLGTQALALVVGHTYQHHSEASDA